MAENECPNARLSFHGPKLRTNAAGECHDCGRKVTAGKVGRLHYRDNGRAAYRTVIEYNGAPE